MFKPMISNIYCVKFCIDAIGWMA